MSPVLSFHLTFVVIVKESVKHGEEKKSSYLKPGRRSKAQKPPHSAAPRKRSTRPTSSHGSPSRGADHPCAPASPSRGSPGNTAPAGSEPTHTGSNNTARRPAGGTFVAVPQAACARGTDGAIPREEGAGEPGDAVSVSTAGG